MSTQLLPVFMTTMILPTFPYAKLLLVAQEPELSFFQCYT